MPNRLNKKLLYLVKKLKTENYSVISFITLSVRNISLEVIHSPTKNQAHSLILNIPPRKQNDARITMLLRDMCKWEIR